MDLIVDFSATCTYQVSVAINEFTQKKIIDEAKANIDFIKKINSGLNCDQLIFTHFLRRTNNYFMRPDVEVILVKTVMKGGFMQTVKLSRLDEKEIQRVIESNPDLKFCSINIESIRNVNNT